ncbi:MAG: hypothetical protein ACR2IJ_06460 [Fluviibacter sp.]
MTDIVERLRREVEIFYGKPPCSLLNEAADEIERLREALRFYANEENWDMKVSLDNGELARAILGGEAYKEKLIYSEVIGASVFEIARLNGEIERLQEALHKAHKHIARKALGEEK